jgi:hypothetical protein
VSDKRPNVEALTKMPVEPGGMHEQRISDGVTESDVGMASVTSVMGAIAEGPRGGCASDSNGLDRDIVAVQPGVETCGDEPRGGYQETRSGALAGPVRRKLDVGLYVKTFIARRPLVFLCTRRALSSEVRHDHSV